MATGRPLTGEKVYQRCKVLIVSLEDGKDELKRRLFATMQHHNIDQGELEGYLFARTPKGLRLMIMGDQGQPVCSQLYHELRDAIIKLNIDVVILDPFVKTHSLPENDNSAIDKVADLLAQLAIEFNIAVDCTHHVHKGAIKPGDADAGRGASAIRDAARLVYTLCPMSPEEAKAFGIPQEQRRRYVRMDSAKVNIAPPAESAM
jgi:RecA-family ATPase